MTFSIVARDSQTGMIGIAVAAKHLAMGALVLSALGPSILNGIRRLLNQAV